MGIHFESVGQREEISCSEEQQGIDKKSVGGGAERQGDRNKRWLRMSALGMDAPVLGRALHLPQVKANFM